MSGLLMAFMIGMLFALGLYAVLSREPIKLVLGINLISYGVNILLFTSTTLDQGLPPIIDKATFTGEISQYVDPLPQALILTAIVISFGITAFLVVLINRHNALSESYLASTPPEVTEIVNDPFSDTAYFLAEIDEDPEDYEWIEDTLHPQSWANQSSK